MYNLPINSANTYLLVIFAIFQGFLILLVLFLFIDKFFSIRKYRIEQNKIKEEAFKQAQDELTTAQLNAQRIVSDAKLTASKIISEVDLFSKSTVEDFNKSLKNTLDSNVDKINNELVKIGLELQKDLDKERISSIAGFNHALNSFESQISQDITEYKELLSHSAVNAQSSLDQKTLDYADEVRQRLYKYEKERSSVLREEGVRILSKLTKEYFTQIPTNKDNESIVEKILSDINFQGISIQ